MRVIFAVVILTAMIYPSFAQQQGSPAQTALQITAIVSQWGQALEACAVQTKELADLKQQLAEKQKKLDELTAKK